MRRPILPKRVISPYVVKPKQERGVNPFDVSAGLGHVEDLQKKLDGLYATYLQNLEKIILDHGYYKAQALNFLTEINQKASEVRDQVKVIKKGDKGDKGDTVVGPPGPMGPKPIAGVDYPIPKNGKDGERVVGPQGKQGERGNDGVSPDPQEIISTLLEIIKEKKLFKVEHIDGLGLQLVNLQNGISAGIQQAGRHYGKDTWAKGGGDRVLAGSNITITTNSDGAKTIASSGGSFSVITVTGTIDNSNRSFTAASTPNLVNVNGVFYRHGHGVTISGTSITLDAPVGADGDIYAV